MIEAVTTAETHIEDVTRSSRPREESYNLIRNDLKTLKDSYTLLTNYESDAAVTMCWPTWSPVMAGGPDARAESVPDRGLDLAHQLVGCAGGLHVALG